MISGIKFSRVKRRGKAESKEIEPHRKIKIPQKYIR